MRALVDLMASSFPSWRAALVIGAILLPTLASRAEDRHPEPVFARVTPSRVGRGSSSARVVIEGRNLSHLKHVAVSRPSVRLQHEGSAEGDASKGSTLLEVRSVTTTTVEVDIPAVLLGNEGFLQLSPGGDWRGSVAFAVSSSGYPPVGSARHMSITCIYQADLSWSGASVMVIGRGFENGVAAVVLRDGRGVLELMTYPDGEGFLEVAPPDEYLGRADDLQLAILSADRASLSNARAVASDKDADRRRAARRVPKVPECSAEQLRGAASSPPGPESRRHRPAASSLRRPGSS